MRPAQRLDARSEKEIRHRWSSAISGLVRVKQLNDRTEVTLPDAEIDPRSRPGPALTANLMRRMRLILSVLRRRHRTGVSRGQPGAGGEERSTVLVGRLF